MCDLRRIAAPMDTYKEILFSDVVDVVDVDQEEEQEQEEPPGLTDSDDDTDEEAPVNNSTMATKRLSFNPDLSLRPETRVTSKTFLLQTATSILNEAWARRFGDGFVLEEDLKSLHMLRQAVQIYCLLKFHTFTVTEKRPDNRFVTRCNSCNGKILAFDTKCTLSDIEDQHFCEVPKLLKKTYNRSADNVKTQGESLLQNVFQKLRQEGYFKLNDNGVEIDYKGYAKDYLLLSRTKNCSVANVAGAIFEWLQDFEESEERKCRTTPPEEGSNRRQFAHKISVLIINNMCSNTAERSSNAVEEEFPDTMLSFMETVNSSVTRALSGTIYTRFTDRTLKSDTTMQMLLATLLTAKDDVETEEANKEGQEEKQKHFEIVLLLNDNSFLSNSLNK